METVSNLQQYLLNSSVGNHEIALNLETSVGFPYSDYEYFLVIGIQRVSTMIF